MLKPYYRDNSCTIYHSHILDVLKDLSDESVQCCVTSPPYWGLRDYKIEPQVWNGGPGCEHIWGNNIEPRATSNWDSFNNYHKLGQQMGGGKINSLERSNQPGHGSYCQKCHAWLGSLGLEPTPELYVKHLVDIFREVRRVLKKDGTLWLNMGDSYAGSGLGWCKDPNSKHLSSRAWADRTQRPPGYISSQQQNGLKPKDLVGIPWHVGFALQADGWWLRSDIIWAKPNPMPESVTDRPTKAHEYIFLMAKSEKYYYNAEMVREPHAEPWRGKGEQERWTTTSGIQNAMGRASDSLSGWGKREYNPAGRNKRTVWEVATYAFPECHFATFPPKLIEPCILAGSPPGGVVLDPFSGSGTTLLVAKKFNRQAIGIELNESYVQMSIKRLQQEVLDLV